MAPLALLAPVSGVLSGTFRALQWPRLLAYTTIVSSVATGSVVLGLILWGSPSSVRVGLAFDIRPIVALALLVLPLVRWWRAGRHLESTSVSTVTTRRIVSVAVGFMFVMTFGAVISQLDVLVLGAFQGARVDGFLLSCIPAIGNFVLGIPAVVGSFFLPAVTRLSAQHDQRGVAALYHWTTRIGIALAAPAVAVLLGVSGRAPQHYLRTCAQHRSNAASDHRHRCSRLRSRGFQRCHTRCSGPCQAHHVPPAHSHRRHRSSVRRARAAIRRGRCGCRYCYCVSLPTT